MKVAETIKRLHNELPPSVRLVAVSKFHPLGAILEAYDAGQRVFGESRPQELVSKVTELRSMSACAGDGSLWSDIEWHFIGHLQTNKLKMVLPYVSMVESVDSLRLLQAIDSWGRDNGKTVDILLEYRISGEETKQGFDESMIREILFSEKKYCNVRFRGLMGMAAFTDDENVIRRDFAKMVSLRSDLMGEKGKHPNLTELFDTFSYGMTNDYAIAVEMGSNTVRIGTLIFGDRHL